jgi:hypothetical protein
VRAVLEYYKKLMAFLPPDAPAWDDASNNKWLVSGRGSLIMNPPSAWAVAKRDAPQVAEQCWTHGFPIGPKGRFAPFLPYYWSIWKFAKNKEAAKSLLVHLSQTDAIEKMVTASGGYDLPAFEKAHHPQDVGRGRPPKGTLYHYPNPHKHQICRSRFAGAAKVAQQIYTQATLTKCACASTRANPWRRRWLGRRRTRRLHAKLRIRAVAAHAPRRRHPLSCQMIGQPATPASGNK